MLLNAMTKHFAFLTCRLNCLLNTNYYSVESNKYSFLWYKVYIFLIQSYIFATYLLTSYDLAFVPQAS